jgi:hypothetical protein
MTELVEDLQKLTAAMKKIILATAVSAALLGSSAFALSNKNIATATVLTNLTPGVTVILEKSAFGKVRGGLKKIIGSILPGDPKTYAISESATDGTEIQYRLENKTVVSCVQGPKGRAIVCTAAANAKKAAAAAAFISAVVDTQSALCN